MDILVANGPMFQLESAKLASDMDLVPKDQYPPLTVANSINRHQLRVVAIGQFSSSEMRPTGMLCFIANLNLHF